MKRCLLLLLAHVMCFQLAYAQLSDCLVRVSVKTLESNMTVDPGAFQIDYELYPKASTYAMSEKFDYVYVARNEETGLSYIFIREGNQEGRMIRQKYQVRPFLIGSGWDDCICVVKFLEEGSAEMGYGMETVYAYGRVQEKCDSVVMLSDDGYVYKLRGNYFYRSYKGRGDSEQVLKVVWPESYVYQLSDKSKLSSNGLECMLSEGDIYHYCSVGEDLKSHFYYLYRDDYMPQPVLVVDGKAVQLVGNCKEEDLRLKFSFNGKHWMAVVGNCFWVDGAMKYAGDYSISDFLIADNGDYYYKASKLDGDGRGEVIIMNGQVIRQHAQVGYFGLDAHQSLKFHFLSGGQWFVYSNGDVGFLCDDHAPICYFDDMVEGLVVNKNSDDMRHTLSYVIGREGIKIDNETIERGTPFQAYYDKGHNCFCWNAIEMNREGRVELVFYRYNCK